MAKTITTRIPDDFVKQIRELAKKENLDISTVIRRLLAESLERQKIKQVFEKLSLHQISIGKAAEILGVSLWDMIDIAKQNNIDWIGYNEKDLERDLKLLKK